MRFPALTMIALTALIATPSWASSDITKSPIFAKSYCNPIFLCSDLENSDKSQEVTAKILSLAETCARGAVGASQASSFFEESYGLDSSLCLTTKDLPKEKGGATLTPKCCVVPTTANPSACQVVCTVHGVK